MIAYLQRWCSNEPYLLVTHTFGFFPFFGALLALSLNGMQWGDTMGLLSIMIRSLALLVLYSYNVYYRGSHLLLEAQLSWECHAIEKPKLRLWRVCVEREMPSSSQLFQPFQQKYQPNEERYLQMILTLDTIWLQLHYDPKWNHPTEPRWYFVILE